MKKINWWQDKYEHQFTATGNVKWAWKARNKKYKDYFYYSLPKSIEETGANSFLFKAEYEGSNEDN